MILSICVMCERANGPCTTVMFVLRLGYFKEMKPSPSLLINSYERYEAYTKNLEKLNSCGMSVNLRGVFDNESTPIYWDQGHVSDKGNNLIAKALQEKIIQLLPKNLPESIQTEENYEIKNLQTETQIHHLLSNYKTPMMISKIFSFENIVHQDPYHHLQYN